jgi:hypothetical protein
MNDFLLPKLTHLLLHQEGIVQPDYNNLQKLSENLLTKKNIHISANTLARLTGLKKETRNHYKHTLDNLAMATGFASYEHYERIFSFKKQSYLSDTTWSQSDFVFSYTESAARKNDTHYFEALNTYISQHGCPVDVMLKLGLAITKGLRVNQEPEKLVPALCDTPVFIDLLFETYVDVDHLSGYYGNAMLLLSKKASQGSRTWLFSNTLAWHYCRLTGNHYEYMKIGELLLNFPFHHAEKLLSEKCVFPYARWTAAALLFAIEQKKIQKQQQLIESVFNSMNILPPDDAMVVISQVSETVTLWSGKEQQELIKYFLKIADAVMFERDSLMNAAINLSILNNGWLMNPIAMKREREEMSVQFFSCSNTLENKYNAALKLIGYIVPAIT